jgi:hypothetical protein
MAPRPAFEKVRPKKSYFSSACEYVKLPFSLRVPKKLIEIKSSSTVTTVHSPVSFASLLLVKKMSEQYNLESF